MGFTLAGKAQMPERPKRRLFAAGKIDPAKPSDGTPCELGRHYGKPLYDPNMIRAGGIWAGMRTCSACGFTVSLDQFVPTLSMDDVLRAMGSE